MSNNTSSGYEKNRSSLHGFEPEFTVQIDLVAIVLALLIIAINSLVVFLFARNRPLRTANNLILVSLAVSDLLTGVLTLPLFVACNIVQGNAVCFASIFPIIFTSVSTVSHLVVITVDRWISVRQPLRYISIVTKARALLAVAAIWLNAVMVTLLQFLWLDPTSFDAHQPPSEHERRSEIIFDSVCFALFVGLPLPFMAATYVWIFRQVRRHSQNIRLQATALVGRGTHARMRQEGRAALMFAGMFLMYAVCWAPYFLLRLQLNTTNISYSLGYFLLFLRFGCSFLNPCIYIFGKHDFRKAAGIRWNEGRKRQGKRSLKTESSQV